MSHKTVNYTEFKLIENKFVPFLNVSFYITHKFISFSFHISSYTNNKINDLNQR